MKKKGKQKVVVKIKRLKSSTGRGIKCRTHQLSMMNRYLSRQIDIQRVINDYPILEVKDGIATNIDYFSPQHLKWLED
ncbi:hypothetical protein HPT25_14325 [Bacillus sp. BRMEA1]|uniref:hypothetical protein n=1 Tax=Neobacillus endophyticus TaxID=2738405 RepID=UPI0015663352|nr:hypothetical protein [Neobacillus endophyticus]NRD78538.1 hypothetical protein [Neobacillus endophyticus]